MISCWFLLFVCLFVYTVLLVGAGRCFQQYNFPRPQFCAVIVCMVQLCLGSFLCTCFSWMARLSWSVSLPVTKAPSVIGGEGWYVEKAAAFQEVAFHRLPHGVTEGKPFKCCTGGFWGWFFWYSLSFPSFYFFLLFSLKTKNKQTKRFGYYPKGCCKTGSRQGGYVTPKLCHPEAMWGCLDEEGDRPFLVVSMAIPGTRTLWLLRGLTQQEQASTGGHHLTCVGLGSGWRVGRGRWLTSLCTALPMPEQEWDT